MPTHAGEFVSVVGPSGCGKSTLLNLAAGILAPSGGQVTLRDEPVNGIPRGVGYVFQTDALLPWKTVADNIGLALWLQKCDPTAVQARVGQWLERTGLKGFGGAYPHQLSGGMRKRVAIAQALVHEPDLVLMEGGQFPAPKKHHCQQHLQYLHQPGIRVVPLHRQSAHLASDNPDRYPPPSPP